MKKRRVALVLFAAALFVPPMFSPSSARAQPPAAVSAAAAIQSFDLDPPERLAPGEALIFRLTGSPLGSASVSIEGVGKVALREVAPGIYEGAYTIKAGDRIEFDSTVIGSLRSGKHVLTTVLLQPLVETSAVAITR